MNNFNKNITLCLLDTLKSMIENDNLTEDQISKINNELSSLVYESDNKSNSLVHESNSLVHESKQNSNNELNPQIINYLFLGWYIDECMKSFGS